MKYAQPVRASPYSREGAGHIQLQLHMDHLIKEPEPCHPDRMTGRTAPFSVSKSRKEGNPTPEICIQNDKTTYKPCFGSSRIAEKQQKKRVSGGLGFRFKSTVLFTKLYPLFYQYFTGGFTFVDNFCQSTKVTQSPVPFVDTETMEFCRFYLALPFPDQ